MYSYSRALFPTKTALSLACNLVSPRFTTSCIVRSKPKVQGVANHPRFTPALVTQNDTLATPHVSIPTTTTSSGYSASDIYNRNRSQDTISSGRRPNLSASLQPGYLPALFTPHTPLTLRLRRQFSSHASNGVPIHPHPHVPAYTSTAWSVLLRQGLDGNLRSVPASTSLRVVAELFLELRTGCLIVVSDSNPTSVEGLICERDVLLAYDAYSNAPPETATEIDTPVPNPIKPSAPLPLHDGTVRSGGFIPVRRRGKDWPGLNGESWDEACAADAMTPASRVVFGNVGDSCELLLSIMARAGFRHLPVIDRQSVDEISSSPDGVTRSRRVEKSYLVGLLTIHDLVDGMFFTNDRSRNMLFSAEGGEKDVDIETNKGVQGDESTIAPGPSSDAKARFIQDVMPRRGFPPHTVVYTAPEAAREAGLYLETGVFSRPHPGKVATGGEDAFFSATFLPGEDNNFNPWLPYSVVGVSDGVSSWREEAGVDAGLFSRRLLSASQHLVVGRVENSSTYQRAKHALSERRSEISDSYSHVNQDADVWEMEQTNGKEEKCYSIDSCVDGYATPAIKADLEEIESELRNLTVPLPLPSPRDLIEAAWYAVKSEKVIGSATLCIGVLSASATGANLKNRMKDKMKDKTKEKIKDKHGNVQQSSSSVPSLSSFSMSTPTSSDEKVIEASVEYIGHTFEAVNVGDSGFMVLRPIKNKSRNYAWANVHEGITTGGSEKTPSDELLVPKYSVVFKSQPMLVEFDCPAQLGVDLTPDGHERFHSPSDAVDLSVPVKEGDLIVMATDGMFDNLFEKDVVQAVNAAEAEAFGISSGMALALPEFIAQHIGTLAFQRSLEKSYDSPFAQIAKDNLMMWSGGRKDDITVTVSRVKRCRSFGPGDVAANAGTKIPQANISQQVSELSSKKSSVKEPLKPAESEIKASIKSTEIRQKDVKKDLEISKSAPQALKVAGDHYISPSVFSIPGFKPPTGVKG